MSAWEESRSTDVGLIEVIDPLAESPLSKVALERVCTEFLSVCYDDLVFIVLWDGLVNYFMEFVKPY